MPAWGWLALAGGVGAAFAYFLGHTSTKRSLNFDATPFTITGSGKATDADPPDEDDNPQQE